jgi:hypothetical protein
VDVLLVFRLCLFFNVLKMASPFDRQRKMNQKESSQPGSVAMIVQWLGMASGCRNITNERSSQHHYLYSPGQAVLRNDVLF